MARAGVTRNRLLDRFELVLLLVLATIGVQGLVDTTGSTVAQVFAHAISGLALIAAARASGAQRRWRRGVDVIFGVALVLSIVTVVVGRGPLVQTAVPPQTAWLVAAALTPYLLARRVLQHRVVTVQTIMGSVAAFLQIAVAYAFLFQTVDAFSSTSFFGEEVPTTVYMYFSVVTLSTVGYGDFTAVTNLGRMAAASEAVIGQVFLVTFVALIVSRFAAGMPRGSLGAPIDDVPSVTDSGETKDPNNDANE